MHPRALTSAGSFSQSRLLQGRQESKAGNDILRMSTSSAQDSAFLWIFRSSGISAISNQKFSPKPQAPKA